MTRLSLALLFCPGLLAQSPTPVIFEGRELWLMRAPIAGLAPEARASDVQSSLLHAAQDSRVHLDDVRAVEGTSDVMMLLGRYLIFAVTEEDARR